MSMGLRFDSASWARALPIAAALLWVLVGCGGPGYRPIEPAFDRLPEPISMRDLVEAEERFGRLDESRWARIEAIHDEYILAYADWRRRSLAQLRATMRGRSWVEVESDPETLTRLERRALANMAALEAIDEGFLAALEDAIAASAWDPPASGPSDDAIAFLRTRRAMARWLAIIEAGGGRPRDLRTWIDRQRRLDRFGESAVEAIDAIVARSERDAIPILRRLAVAEWSLPRRAAAIAAQAPDRGRGDDFAPKDPPREGQVQESDPESDLEFEPATDEATPPDPEAIAAKARVEVATALQELLSLQERTIREIASLLPDPAGLVLESEFLADLLQVDRRAGIDGDPAIDEIVAMAIAREVVGSESEPPNGSALLAELVALSRELRGALSPQEQARLVEETRPLLERRAALLRRLLEVRRSVSVPGTAAGGTRSDDRRAAASREVFEALEALGVESAGWLDRGLDRRRLEALLRREAARPSVGSVVEFGPGPDEVPPARANSQEMLGRFDRPLEVPPLEGGPLGLQGEKALAWLARRIGAICGLDDTDAGLLMQVVEADRERRERLREEGEARIERRGREAIAELEVFAARLEAPAGEGGQPDPAVVMAAREVIARHAAPLAADFERLVLEMEACHAETIEGLRAALPIECVERCAPILRLAIAESLWQSISTDRPAGRDVTTGAGLSIARIMLALPLDAEEVAVCGELAEEATSRIREALRSEHAAAIAAWIALLERELKLAPPTSPGKPRREATRLVAARGASLAAQLDLMESIESEWPEASASMREGAMQLRWDGLWDDTALIARSVAGLVLTDAALAAWTAWRSACAEALARDLLAKPAAASSAIGLGADPAGSVRSLLHRDPELHAATTARREGLLKAARRIAAEAGSTELGRAEALRAIVIAHPSGNLDGDRIWE